jgi:hypothetical protein
VPGNLGSECESKIECATGLAPFSFCFKDRILEYGTGRSPFFYNCHKKQELGSKAFLADQQRWLCSRVYLNAKVTLYIKIFK